MITASSQGRLDIMGGIADYSGALVLQLALKHQTTVSIKPTNGLTFRLISGNQRATLSYTSLLLPNGEVDYAFARQYFRENPTIHWASYVVGCLLVLQKEKGVLPLGFDVEISSDIPIGKGVSSSAALEVATMKALGQHYKLSFVGTELPVLAQKVENLVVGAPCGLMDQLASYLGSPNKLLPILCQPDVLLPPITLPSNLKFIGIDSDIRHSIGGASYGEVRTAAFMGLKMINQRNNTQISYLANISPQEFQQNHVAHLPEALLGRVFMEQYHSTDDPVTAICPNSTYHIRQATAHPIYEHARIQQFRQIISDASLGLCSPNDFESLGKMMYESHQSYSDCGLGSTATDTLVNMVKRYKGQGVYGAKITGGGSGGTVCVLCDTEQGIDTVREIYECYCQEIQKKVVIFE